MKKAFLISLFLIVVSLSGFAQTSIQGREVDVRAFGAKCDGSTNDTSAIQAAITAMATAGGVVNLPDGTCIVTGLTAPGGVTLRGKGKYVTTIKSSTNAVILNLVQGSGAFAFFGPKVADLAVDGSDSGSSQVGIQATDASAMRDVVIEDVQVTDCGSHGLSFGNVFSSSFKNIYSSSNQGYNFFYNSPNMPSNYFYGLYSGDISAAAPAGFRIKQGNFTCWSCNGVNVVPATAYWAVIGGAAGDIDGDVGPFYASAKFTDCNIEGAPTAGVLVYPGSVPSFDGLTTFVGLLASSGSWSAILYDTDVSLTPENWKRGYIADTVVFSNSPASFYANSQPIRSDGLPPLSVNGRGPQIAGGGAAGLINTYYNTATSRAERLPRADGYAPTIDITTSTSFTNPGGRAYRVNCASPCTLTLPSPNFYENGNEIITVFNLSATGTNVTIAANGGATVNGSTYVLSVQGMSVQLFPDFTSLDWRIVSTRQDTGTTPRVPYYADTNRLTTASGFEYDSGSAVVKSPGRFWAADTSASNPSFSFTGDTDTGFYRPSANTIGITANGANVGSFGTTGLTLGVPGSVAGALIFGNTSNSNTTTLQSGAPASSLSITLPTTLPASAGCLQISSTGVITQTGSACGAGVGSVEWQAITNPTGNQVLSMAAFTTAWTWNAATGASNLFSLTDTASNTGTGYVFSLNTASGSAAKPARITAGGVVNGVEMTTAGVLVAIGTGEIRATMANPSASIGLTANNGSATSAMRSDATPALSQAIAPTWTGLHTFNPGTTPSDVVLFDIAAIGSAGTRDSHNLVMRGRSNNGSAHTVEWKQFIDVTSNAGASQWVLQSNLDGGSFSNWLTVKDDGEVLLGNITGSSATFGANVAADTLSATTSLTVTGTSTMREIDPEADNTYDLGTTSLRWKTVHVGPGSLVVHNDATNTLKTTLGFSGSTAQLTTDSATPLQLRTGSNNGLFLNTNGTIGFNLTSAPNGNVDLRQIANGDQILNLRRATDTSPTGNFINFENAAGTDLFTVDIAGSLSAGSVPTGRLTGTLAAGQFPALTGDVTTTAGNVATTIANDAVTFAKMQNVSAASKLLGRGDSGSGDVQEITIGSGLAMTGTTLSATGGGSGNVTTAGGTSGRYTKFTSGVNIENALLSESGNDISGTATLTLTNPSTSSRLLVGRSITSQSADMFALFSTSDANPRVAVDSSFRLQFGPGGATSVDTNLYRSSAAVLRTDGGFVAGTSGTFVIAGNGNITSIRGVATNFPASNSAGVLTNDGSGNFTWVASSNPFTASAGIIDFTTSTDRLRLVAGSTSTTPLEVDGVPSQTANLLQVKATSGAANPILAVDSSGRLQFGAGGGTAVDTNLYRNSANALKTDDSFTAAGGLTSENNIGVTGTSLRFTADFSNATLTNRFMFQSNTTNGSTFVSTLPNGSDTFSGFVAYNSSSPTSAHYVRMFLNSTTSALIDSGKNGGGAVAPLGFAHNAAQIATFTTGGHFTVGAAGTTDAAFLTVAGGISTATTTVSANTTLNDTHSSILCNASGAVRTMTLPAASGLTGRTYTIKKTDSSANACILDANASETIDGSLTLSLTGQYDSVTIQTDGSNWFRVGQQIATAQAGYISGLVLEWVSTTQVRVTSGSAQIQSTGQLLVAPSTLTITPTIGASTWYHCYVFESSGVAALECVTTAPASAWIGTARSKTSDTARRYVGSIRTNASSQIINFVTTGGGNHRTILWRTDTLVSPFRTLSGGLATTNTNVSFSSVVPDVSGLVKIARMRLVNLCNNGVYVFVDNSEMTSTNPAGAQGFTGIGQSADVAISMPLNASQTIRYAYSGGTPTGSGAFIEIQGYELEL